VVSSCDRLVDISRVRRKEAPNEANIGQVIADTIKAKEIRSVWWHDWHGDD
jgi:hypothetical protein